MLSLGELCGSLPMKVAFSLFPNYQGITNKFRLFHKDQIGKPNMFTVVPLAQKVLQVGECNET